MCNYIASRFSIACPENRPSKSIFCYIFWAIISNFKDMFFGNEFYLNGHKTAQNLIFFAHFWLNYGRLIVFLGQFYFEWIILRPLKLIRRPKYRNIKIVDRNNMAPNCIKLHRFRSFLGELNPGDGFWHIPLFIFCIFFLSLQHKTGLSLSFIFIDKLWCSNFNIYIKFCIIFLRQKRAQCQ